MGEGPGRRAADPVQHHHAHVAACAAEHQLTGAFTGVAYDGLGLGSDGTLWGGEILVADLRRCRRVGRFATARCRAAPPRSATPPGWPWGTCTAPSRWGLPAARPADPLVHRASGRHRGAGGAHHGRPRGQLPRASSAGRLFDAVAALLGLGDTVSYEARNAVALEAAGATQADALPWRVVRAAGLWVYDPRPPWPVCWTGAPPGRGARTRRGLPHHPRRRHR
ncbi:hypothetical protein NKH77_50955 [Streptomyces sp. M19]